MREQNKTAVPATGASRRHITYRQLAAILIALAAAFFIGQNRDQANVTLLFVTASLPLWLVLTVTAAAGVAVGWLLHRRSA